MPSSEPQAPPQADGTHDGTDTDHDNNPYVETISHQPNPKRSNIRSAKI